jgi:hypothetical protein
LGFTSEAKLHLALRLPFVLKLPMFERAEHLRPIAQIIKYGITTKHSHSDFVGDMFIIIMAYYELGGG